MNVKILRRKRKKIKASHGSQFGRSLEETQSTEKRKGEQKQYYDVFTSSLHTVAKELEDKRGKMGSLGKKLRFEDRVMKLKEF